MTNWAMYVVSHCSCCRNAQSMRPRHHLQLEPPQQQQPQSEQQPQQQEAGPLGVIAASGMQPPPSKRGKTSNAAAAGANGSDAAHIGQDQAAAHNTAAAAAAGAGDASSEHGQPSKQPGQVRQPPHAHSAQHQQQPRKQSPKGRILSAQRQIKALSRVSFRAGNWLDVPCPSNKYEVITCFSVTKWIQLNWGDDGIMKLFNKFYR